MKRYLQALVTVMLFSSGLYAQQHKFQEDVETIKKYDKIYVPSNNPILFVGSSSIRKWIGFQTAFGNLNVINRGVGGAVTDDITYYLEDIVFPYQPRQIVLYVGENDLLTQTADSIFTKTVRLLQAIRIKMPNVPILYIAIKPSPVRAQHLPKAVATNQLIKNYLEKMPNMKFLDIYPLMLSKEGKTRPELFLKDMLHMNQKGYDIWNKVIQPKLVKNEL